LDRLDVLFQAHVALMPMMTQDGCNSGEDAYAAGAVSYAAPSHWRCRRRTSFWRLRVVLNDDVADFVGGIDEAQ
jgi:hypothetical protein